MRFQLSGKVLRLLPFTKGDFDSPYDATAAVEALHGNLVRDYGLQVAAKVSSGCVANRIVVLGCSSRRCCGAGACLVFTATACLVGRFFWDLPPLGLTSYQPVDRTFAAVASSCEVPPTHWCLIHPSPSCGMYVTRQCARSQDWFYFERRTRHHTRRCATPSPGFTTAAHLRTLLTMCGCAWRCRCGAGARSFSNPDSDVSVGGGDAEPGDT